MFEPNRDEEIRLKLALLEEKCNGRAQLESSLNAKLHDAVDRLTVNIEKLSDISAKNTADLEVSREKFLANDADHKDFDKKLTDLVPLKMGLFVARSFIVGLVAILVFSVSNITHINVVFQSVFEALQRKSK